MIDIFRTIFKYKEKQSPDKLGYFPERVHVDAMPERRYLWTSRFLVIFASFSVSLNMMIASSLYVMLPQRSASPQLFYIDHYFSQIERAQPMEIDFPVGNLINQEHITTYLMMRYLITDDYDELLRRWGEGSYIYWYSSPFVYNQFQTYDAQYNMNQFRRKQMMRDVEIDWIRSLGKGLWQAQYRTLDYAQGSVTPSINIWRATMRIRFVNMTNMSKEDALKNPYGFLITSFSLSYLGKNISSQDYLSETKRISKELFFR